MKSGNLNFLEPSGPLQACNGTAFTIAIIHYERVLATLAIKAVINERRSS